MSEEYTVHLERVFQGPMDLLLHLVREQEVEIHEIEIGPIVEGYLRYLKALEQLDIELAGDFLVMAATLMAIKSRSLLPREQVELDDELDPRDELIQRLLEYRRFKEAASDLELRERERSLLTDRGYRGEVKELAGERMFDLGELTVWDLLSTFSRLMRETAADRPHRMMTDPRPLRFYVDHLVGAVKRSPQLSLRELARSFPEGLTRETVVGSFCAILELVRLNILGVQQDAVGADIGICLLPEHRDDVDSVVREAGFEEELSSEEGA